MSRLLHWRLPLALVGVLGYASCITESSSAQSLPPRPIIPFLNNGSVGVWANPNAVNLAKFGQPVFSFIAAQPLDVRLLKAGVPISVDRLIIALQPGTQLQVSAPAGQVQVQGPNPLIANYFLGWGARRNNYPPMGSYTGGSTPYWAYNNYPSHNPFTNYTGFFPQQEYSTSNSQSELYSLYNAATAYNVQQSQMTPYFGSFSSTSMSSAASANSSTEANPFAAFDAPKDKKSEEPKNEQEK